MWYVGQTRGNTYRYYIIHDICYQQKHDMCQENTNYNYMHTVGGAKLQWYQVVM